MNMSVQKYPHPGAYVTLWRRVKALPASDAYIVEADRRGWGDSANTLKRRFRDAVHNRINVRGKVDMSGRKWDEDYQTNLFRDQHALHDKLQKRVMVYQFLTDTVRNRFGHLLTDRREM